MIFFHKAQALVVLSLSLKRKKAWASMGLKNGMNLKNGMGLTPCKLQGVGLRALVNLGRAFLNTGRPEKKQLYFSYRSIRIFSSITVLGFIKTKEQV